MKRRLCFFIVAIANILSITSAVTTAQVQQTPSFKRGVEYKCGNERVVVYSCRNDSGSPVNEGDNYCNVEYPDRPRRLPEIAVFALVLKSEIAAKLKSCIDPTSGTAGADTNSMPGTTSSTVNQALAKGQSLIAAKDYTGAMVELKEALRLDPRSASAFYLVGIAQFNLKEYTVANAAFERALQLQVPNPHFAYYWIGDCQRALGQNEKALSAYREAVRTKPDYAGGFNGMGLAYYATKDFANALIFFDQAVRLDPRTAIYRKNAGKAYLGLGKKDEAMKVYNALVAVDQKLAGELLDEITTPAATSAAANPRTPAETSFDNGTKFYTAKDYQKALASFQDAMRLKPDFGTASHYLGMTLYQLKQYPEAIAAFENALKFKFANPHHSHLWIGDTYNAQKQYARAITAYQEAVRLKPDYDGAFVRLGSAHYALKQYTEALTAYQAAIKIKPDDAVCHASMGDSYHALKQYDKAALSYGEATRINPNYDYALNMLGVSHYKLNQYPAAVAAYEALVKLKPDNATYQINLGNVYIDLGRKSDALAVHKKLMTLDKAKADELLALINKSPAEDQANAAADAAIRKGNELFEAKEYAKAIVEYQKAVAAKPNNAWLAVAHASIGSAHTFLRDYAQATTDLLTAARLDPTYAGVFGDIGYVYERTLQFPRALAAYQEAVRLSENDKKLSQRQRDLGKIYVLMGRRAEAMQIYTNLQKTDPALAKSLLAKIEEADKTGPAGILASEAFAWQISGESDDAQELYQNALKLKPTNPKVLFEIGKGLGIYGGKFAESLAVYRQVLAQKPNTSDRAQAHYYIGQTFNMMAEYARAIPEIREAQRLKADSDYSQELGDSFRGLKRFPEALAAYQDAERLKSDDSTTKIRISETYVEMGQHDKAVAYLSEQTRDPAKTPPILNEELGKLYSSLKRYPEAVTAYKRAIASYPGNKSANYGLATVYVAMGQKQDAMAVYRVLRPLDNSLAQKLLAEINK
jgi:tetratricopeptide (TPR) repeat protein